MIDWQALLATPYGAHPDALTTHSELVHRNRFSRRYRTGPNQYLEFFDDPLHGQVKYRGFGWCASEGAARIIYLREGGAEIGVAEAPPAILLPRPGMLSVEEIAEYGSRTEPESFSRYVDLTHQVRFGDFCYHFQQVTPRPTDAPIAIQVHRDRSDPFSRKKFGPLKPHGA